MELAVRFSRMMLSLEDVELHIVVSGAANKVISHELGEEWASAQRFCDLLAADEKVSDRLFPWRENDLTAPIASGSFRLDGVVVLPCSAGTAGALANGISRGLGQRVADVALKQRWPLVLGVRETPMSVILLENLHRLAAAGAYVVPPIPAFYLKPARERALCDYLDHYCMRLLDLLVLPAQHDDLRWKA
jgi:polyprenyl P-hydroxybenzoate/phenylacrylic acid decarboxylase-like protein